MSVETVCVVGFNCTGEFGLGHNKDKHKLTSCKKYTKDKFITNIVSGSSYSIYINEVNQDYYVAGSHFGKIVGRCSKSNTLRMVTYFKEKDINIIKVFTSPHSLTTFWITDKDIIYATGNNRCYQLGLDDYGYKLVPVKIDFLCFKNVIDIQCAGTYSIALCHYSNTITQTLTKHWSPDTLPTDILTLISMFFVVTRIYSTQFSQNGGDGHVVERTKTNKSWKQVDIFDRKDIIKIATGKEHSLFLSSNGKVWGCGDNEDRAHVLGGTNLIQVHASPQIIPFFERSSIEIIDIKSGNYFSLALSSDGHVYSWGDNWFHQLGRPKQLDQEKPCAIQTLLDHEIVTIKCGQSHCCAITSDGLYFLWGSDSHYQCSLNKYINKTRNKRRNVKTPMCINKTVEEITKGKKIKNIFLGLENTKLLVY